MCEVDLELGGGCFEGVFQRAERGLFGRWEGVRALL